MQPAAAAPAPASAPRLFENPDGSHCFQAVLRSVLHHFLPSRELSWEDLDGLSGKRPGRWTWPTTALLAMHDLGLAVVTQEDFDYRAFAERGEGYLEEHLGAAVARAQAAHSDLEYEREAARRYAEVGAGELRAPDLDDVARLLGGGHLVVCNVNRAVLKGRPGYSGHFVLVYGLDEESVWLHDPGPPTAPEQRVPRPLFLAAWAYPDERAKNLMAFRGRS